MESIVRKGDIVVAPEGCQVYLTAGKEYEVIEDGIYKNTGEYFFRIKAENGTIFPCELKGDFYTNFNKWIIKGEAVISSSNGGEVCHYQKGPDKTLLDVATQIYCARIISGKYGTGDHVLHGSTDDARKLIEMCTIK
jgi:hypothetical protein